MKSGYIEYKMTKKMANELLKERKGGARNKQNQEYLCQYVNENCGLKGECIKVITDLE